MAILRTPERVATNGALRYWGVEPTGVYDIEAAWELGLRQQIGQCEDIHHARAVLQAVNAKANELSAEAVHHLMLR